MENKKQKTIPDRKFEFELKKKPRVLYELYVLPHYSVPLFDEFSKYVDLLVVIDKDTSIDGLKSVKPSKLFKVIELKKNTGQGLFHPDILKTIEEFKPDVYLSFLGSFDRILREKKIYEIIKSLDIKIIAAGCDGYDSKNHIIALIKKIIHPRVRIIDTIKNIVAISRIDKFLMYSSRSADFLNKEFFVPRKKIYITGNAINTSVLNKTSHEIRMIGGKPVPYKIAFCGRLTPSKKPDVLIKALRKIVNLFPKATLDIIGDGSEREKLEKLATELGLKDKVNFFGGIYEDEEMAYHLCSSSLYVMPGLGGLGLNTAMACGLPIVYTDGDGTEREMLLSRNIGWYFDGSIEDLVAKIVDAFSNPEKMKSDGELGEKLILEKYSVENMIDIYMQAIRE